MNAQPRRALDAEPWPLKNPLYPVSHRKGDCRKRPRSARGFTRRAPSGLHTQRLQYAL